MSFIYCLKDWQSLIRVIRYSTAQYRTGREGLGWGDGTDGLQNHRKLTTMYFFVQKGYPKNVNNFVKNEKLQFVQFKGLNGATLVEWYCVTLPAFHGNFFCGMNVDDKSSKIT